MLLPLPAYRHFAFLGQGAKLPKYPWLLLPVSCESMYQLSP